MHATVPTVGPELPVNRVSLTNKFVEFVQLLSRFNWFKLFSHSLGRGRLLYYVPFAEIPYDKDVELFKMHECITVVRDYCSGEYVDFFL